MSNIHILGQSKKKCEVCGQPAHPFTTRCDYHVLVRRMKLILEANSAIPSILAANKEAVQLSFDYKSMMEQAAKALSIAEEVVKESEGRRTNLEQVSGEIRRMAKNFVPRHRRESSSFKPRKHEPERERRQALYRADDSWRKYCARFLALNPKCYACGERATVVDHLVPHKGDEKLFKATDNHIPLCERDHNTVTGKFDYRYVPGSSIQAKVDWLNARRVPTDTWTPAPVKVLPSYE